MQLITVTVTILALVTSVLSKCECGFRDEVGRTWMDGLVVPFDKVADLTTSPDLYLHEYIQSSPLDKIPYHVINANSYKDGSDLVLKVSAATSESKTILSSKVSSRRKDLFYGTYRSLIELPKQVGSTCVGFFTFFNDTQEIDIEYIGQRPDMLYFSTKSSNVADIAHLNYRYGAGLEGQFHDYRFDWLPGQVDFFVNDALKFTTKDSVPVEPARWMLMNWANGNNYWSGLPLTDSLARAKNVRVFFNSTHPYVISGFASACAANPNSMCDVATFPANELYGYEQNAIRNHVVKNGNDQPDTSIYNNDRNRGTATSASSNDQGLMGKFVSALVALAIVIRMVL